jgi:hypothetical protein
MSKKDEDLIPLHVFEQHYSLRSSEQIDDSVICNHCKSMIALQAMVIALRESLLRCSVMSVVDSDVLRRFSE